MKMTFYTNSCLLLFCFIFSVLNAAERLGPTGIHGELQTWPPPPKEFITVTKIEDGSPASGKVKVGDVIVGVDKQKFKGNPQYMLAEALDKAETEEAGGKLTLMLKTGNEVTIELPVLGKYSATAPYNCPKSEKIIEQTLKALIYSIENPPVINKRVKKFELLATKSEILGLMATGEKKYIELAGKLIKESDLLKIDPVQVEDMFKDKKDLGLVGWYWGYNLIALGEYYLLTKDESVLQAMRIYAINLARGQDPSGCWGHRMAIDNRLPGYAQMNQPSLSNFMGLIIARKCGIKDPILDKAIEKSFAYVVDHVNRGSFPYGVSGPAADYFNNNGMSGSAAVCMSLLGDKKAASYFSQIAATSYDSLTSGHANNYFNPLWTSLGANLSGPEVTQKFFRNSLWYFNHLRHWRDGFPGTNAAAGSYAGLALLFYCMPRKTLLITGREADSSIWFKDKAADEVIMRSKLVSSDKSVEELLKLLDTPQFPQVSVAVAKELAIRMKAENRAKKPDSITGFIIKFIENSPTPLAKANAIACFGGDCPPHLATPYTEKIGAILRDKSEPLEVRIAAAATLGSRPFQAAKVAYPYYNDVLELVMIERPWADPFNHTDVKIAEALDGICPNPLKENLVKDKALFYLISIRFMDHKRQKGRAVGASMLRGISLEDFHIIADKLMYVLYNNDPTYQSYHNVQDTVAAGVQVLADLNIKEGLDILENTIFHQEGKWGFKQKMLMSTLPLYGNTAKDYIPKFVSHPNISKNKNAPEWLKLFNSIQEDKSERKLITIEEAKQKEKK